MKYPLPIEIVKGRYPVVTQEFGDPTRAAWYKANGVNIEAHNGTDIVIGGGKNQAVDTYGTKLVCSVPRALRTKVWFEDAMSTKGNGIQIQWNDDNGFCQALVWHCSECVLDKDEFKSGDTLGYMGNSGLVSPAPSFFAVHNGAHLHLGTWINGALVDPRTIFDFSKWFVSETDTSVTKDLPPFQYFLNKIFQSLGLVKTQNV